jgi:hypothetical protein
MTATPITPGLPVVVAPPIYAVLDYYPTHNTTEAAIFEAAGPVGLLRKLGIPALTAGAKAVIVRMIPGVDWRWLASWDEAATNLNVPLFWYANPLGWNSVLAERIVALCRRVVLEFNGQATPDSWVRGYLAADHVLWGVEPGIEKSDEVALRHNVPMVLNDADWDSGYPAGALAWAHGWQIEPKTYAGGVIRYYQGLPANLPAWYKSCQQPWCRGVIVAAEYVPGMGVAT